MRVAGYVRVSTDEQKMSGLGVEAQIKAMSDECRRRGWTLTYVCEEPKGISARYGTERPALDAARKLCLDGEADVLMAAKLDRFARSARFLAELIEESDGRYRLVFLDLGGIDTGTAAGKMFCQMLGVFAEFERDLISERTKLALKAKKVRNEPLGAPKVIAADVEERILALRGEQYLSHRRIADVLNADGIPAPRGGKWGRSTVAKVLERATSEAGEDDVQDDAVAA